MADHLSQSSSDSSLISVGSSSAYADVESASAELIQNKHNKHCIEKERNSISTCTRAAAITSLLLSVVCVLVVATFCSWFFFVNGGVLSASVAKVLQPNEEVCLPCIQVNPNPFEDTPSSDIEQLDIRYDSENDTEICCALTSAQYAALFKLILKRQQEVKNLADVLGSASSQSKEGTAMAVSSATSAVSAHLVYKPKTAAHMTSIDMQYWKTPAESAGRSHVREGLKYHDNRIYVQTPGLYFVYCQIMYGDSSEPSSQRAEPRVISNYVERFSVVKPGISGILLKSRHTRYHEEKDRHSSYVGGLFQLHQGDQLYVRVAHQEYVAHDDMASFFGLFKVSG